MANAIHAVRDGNNVDAFSDDSDVILNQAVFEPVDRHKFMTTGRQSQSRPPHS